MPVFADMATIFSLAGAFLTGDFFREETALEDFEDDFDFVFFVAAGDCREGFLVFRNPVDFGETDFFDFLMAFAVGFFDFFVGRFAMKVPNCG